MGFMSTLGWSCEGFEGLKEHVLSNLSSDCSVGVETSSCEDLLLSGEFLKRVNGGSMGNETPSFSEASLSSPRSPHQDFGCLASDFLISNVSDSEVPPCKVHLSGNSWELSSVDVFSSEVERLSSDRVRKFGGLSRVWRPRKLWFSRPSSETRRKR